MPKKWKKQLKWERDTLTQFKEGFEKVTEKCSKLLDKDQVFIEMLAHQDCDLQTLENEGKEVKSFKEWIERNPGDH